MPKSCTVLSSTFRHRRHKSSCLSPVNFSEKRSFSPYQWFFNLGSIEPQGFGESVSVARRFGDVNPGAEWPVGPFRRMPNGPAA